MRDEPTRWAKVPPPPAAAPSPLGRTPASALAHLALPSELLKSTLRERGRRGWAAVAPELEPYLDARRWPSGAPMLDDIATHLRRRIRMAPWVPHAVYLLLAVPLLSYIPILLCAAAAHALSPTLAGRWPSLRTKPLCAAPAPPGTPDAYDDGAVNFLCMPCFEFIGALMLLLTVVLYGVFRINKQVEQHVNCLYMMYALAHSTPSMPHEPMHHFKLNHNATAVAITWLEVTVFADGAYEMQIRMMPQKGNDARSREAGVQTISGNVHGMHEQRGGRREEVRECMEPLLGPLACTAV